MKISASKLELLERCPAAGALPVVWEESTDAQLAGTARHRYLQRAREVGPVEALAEIPLDAPWRGQCEAIPLDEVPDGEHELAYAYDVEADTARCLGPWLDRAYATTDAEVSGTLEVLDTELISLNVLQDIFDAAGLKGLGDWRPGGKTPGPFGQFRVKLSVGKK